MTTAYLVDSEQLERLEGIKRALHGDGTVLTPERRRDLAASLTLLLWQIRDQPWCDIPGEGG